MAQIDWTANNFGIASNQAGVGKGLLSEVVALELLVSLAHTVTGQWPPVGAVRMCPHNHHVDTCWCRKPSPWMLWEIMRCYGVPRAADGTVRSDVMFVGDMDTDRQAALGARVMFTWAWDFFGSTKEAWERAIGYVPTSGPS